MRTHRPRRFRCVLPLSACLFLNKILYTINMADTSPSEQIDNIIKNASSWHGETLARLRSIINQADPNLTEDVKWKKPSRPEGVAVWVRDGNVCIGEMLKNAVRLTFPNGAQVSDPKQLFNTRLDSKSIRAIDFSENAVIDEAALKEFVIQAAELNAAKSK